MEWQKVVHHLSSDLFPPFSTTFTSKEADLYGIQVPLSSGFQLGSANSEKWQEMGEDIPLTPSMKAHLVWAVSHDRKPLFLSVAFSSETLPSRFQ